MSGNPESPEERATQEEVARGYAELFTEVQAILFRHDPIGINLEAKPDEYSPEVGTILPRLKEVDTPRELQAVIHEEFVHWFSPDVAGPEERYAEIARDVWEAMLRHYAAKGAAPKTWLWSCAPRVTREQIAGSLGLERASAGELDASGWASKGQVMGDLAALGLPDYFGRNWDAADESLGELMHDGYLLIIRNIRRRGEGNAGRVVDVVADLWQQPARYWPKAPVAVVLPGWRKGSIEAQWRNGMHASHPVRPLPL